MLRVLRHHVCCRVQLRSGLLLLQLCCASTSLATQVAICCSIKRVDGSGSCSGLSNVPSQCVRAGRELEEATVLGRLRRLKTWDLTDKELEQCHNAGQTVSCFDRLAAWQQGGRRLPDVSTRSPCANVQYKQHQQDHRRPYSDCSSGSLDQGCT